MKSRAERSPEHDGSRLAFLRESEPFQEPADGRREEPGTPKAAVLGTAHLKDATISTEQKRSAEGKMA